ncbi:nicotinate-nucleotide--dimethylbenzimidazole phosphoribosyltransferase [Kordiimonas pumila]|uniref:Nicotinate-nucleotide--dimethylbenzimidazole phosphoribosyltransferase n=1 Tax=Kordiimonas pumila TaxID=2161677 RepID=A0ABV7D3B5_9PROT|nr:nicotinate-nucleotide--dimethylbenzimidazole phosphoribosyltransferase [Kordiimonas pumila]
MQPHSPFSDLQGIIHQLPDIDHCAVKKAQTACPSPTMQQGLTLIGLKTWLAGWQGSETPSVNEAHICVLASCYKGEDVSSVKNFIAGASKGTAPVNRLCVDMGVGLRVLELAPELPHACNDGWLESECMAAVAFGMEATAAGGNILGLSAIAPGGKAAAISVIKSIYDESLGLVQPLHNVNGEVIDAISVLHMMRTNGGREIAASIGALVAARSRRLPVLIDAWAGLAAVAVLEAVQKGASDHVLVAAAEDDEYMLIARQIGKVPLVGFCIDEGTGCGVASSMALLKAACDI